MSKSTPLSVEFFEKFVITINKRFDKIDQRFDSVDKRFHSIDERFDTMNKRFDGMDKRFDNMDDRFDSMENRLSKEIEDLAFATKRGFDHMDERFNHLEEDVDVLKIDMKDCKQYIQSSTLESASNRVRLQHLEAHIS